MKMLKGGSSTAGTALRGFPPTFSLGRKKSHSQKQRGQAPAFQERQRCEAILVLVLFLDDCLVFLMRNREQPRLFLLLDNRRRRFVLLDHDVVGPRQRRKRQAERNGDRHGKC